MEFCRYRKGYKYQLASPFSIQTSMRPAKDIATEFVCLSKEGKLWIKQGYAWDGPSGPVIDRPRNLRGSLVHDALYQLIRLRLLKSYLWKNYADYFFSVMCKEDGVPGLWARAYYKILGLFGSRATKPSSKKKIYSAPLRRK